jgi:hypothetical protein
LKNEKKKGLPGSWGGSVHRFARPDDVGAPFPLFLAPIPGPVYSFVDFVIDEMQDQDC